MNDSHIKLINFGLPKRVQWGQTKNCFVGTDEIMAPEVYIQHPQLFLANNWSFGALSSELFYLELAVAFKKRPRGTKRSIFYSAKVILVLTSST